MLWDMQKTREEEKARYEEDVQDLEMKRRVLQRPCLSLKIASVVHRLAAASQHLRRPLRR